MHSLGSSRGLDTVSTAQYLHTSCISVGKHPNQYASRLHLSRDPSFATCFLQDSCPTCSVSYPALILSSKLKAADQHQSHPCVLAHSIKQHLALSPRSSDLHQSSASAGAPWPSSRQRPSFLSDPAWLRRPRAQLCLLTIGRVWTILLASFRILHRHFLQPSLETKRTLVPTVSMPLPSLGSCILLESLGANKRTDTPEAVAQHLIRDRYKPQCQ